MAASRRLAAAVQHASARGVPHGSGESRLFLGNAPEHEAREENSIRFFGCEGALFLSWDVAANVAQLAILERRGDFAI